MLLDVATKLLTDDNNDNGLGTYVQNKVNDISDKTQRLIAVELINDVLFEAALGNLTRSSKIVTNNEPPQYYNFVPNCYQNMSYTNMQDL